MEEESEEDPHGHITSLAVRRSHRSVGNSYELREIQVMHSTAEIVVSKLTHYILWICRTVVVRIPERVFDHTWKRHCPYK